MAEKEATILQKQSEKNGVGEEERDSYRCNACCTEFQLIDELIEHVSQSHVNADGAVVCGDCQLEYRGIDEFLDHYRQCHDENSEKNQDDAYVKMSVDTGQISPDDSSNQITILNDEGETVGLANTSDHQTEAETGNESPTSNLQRKRRPLVKLRDALYEPSVKKLPKVLHTQPSVTTMARSSEVEIDVTDINVVRLKTSKQDRQEEILQYLQRVDEKLDCIIKHFNVPYSGSAGPVTNTCSSKSRKLSVTSKSLANDAPLQLGVTSQDSRSPVVRQGDLHFMEAETTQQEITQYIISDDLLEATYIKSRNRGNFAKNLVFAAFPLEERLGRNCYGRRGSSLSGPKGALEAAKLDAVREAVFTKYPLETNEDEDYIWKRECVIAIDTALRSEMRTRIIRMQKI